MSSKIDKSDEKHVFDNERAHEDNNRLETRQRDVNSSTASEASTTGKETSTTEKELEEKEEGNAADQTDATEEDIKAAWTEAWDDQSQAYYWWNTITYESTWENPNDTATKATTTTRTELDSVLDTIDKQVRTKLDGPSDRFASPSYQQQQTQQVQQVQQYHNPLPTSSDPFRFQAFFNTKTGRFQTAGEASQRHPDQYSIESRARRQMEHYFDVDAYQAERNQQLDRGKKRSLTKKEIERFKRAKKEKKTNRMREWLRD